MKMLAENCRSPACIHHSASLHFPLSSLSGLSFSGSYQFNLKEKHTFLKHPPSFVSPPYRTIFITLSSQALFLIPPVFYIPNWARLHFVPSPLHGLVLPTTHLQCLVFTGQYPLAHISLKTPRHSQGGVCLNEKEGCTFLIRSQLFSSLSGSDNTYSHAAPPPPNTTITPRILSILTHHHCQS